MTLSSSGTLYNNANGTITVSIPNTSPKVLSNLVMNTGLVAGSNIYVNVATANVVYTSNIISNNALSIKSGDYTWQYTMDGFITTPQNGTILGYNDPTTDGVGSLDFVSGSGTAGFSEVWLRHNKSVDITTNNATYTWSFGNTGIMTFPDGSLQSTAFTGNSSSVFFGNSTSNSTIAATQFTMLSDVAFAPQILARNYTDNGFGPYWNSGKSRSGGIVQSGDDLGTFMFQGHDGNTFVNSAYLLSEVDGAPVANSGVVPSRFGFVVSNTTALSTRLTITSSTITTPGSFSAVGQVSANGGVNVTSASGRIQISTDSGGSVSIGRVDNVASAPYIDFNSGATTIDYDARISAAAGNGTVGAATLTVSSGATTLTSNTMTIGTAAYHAANGNLGLGTASPSHTLHAIGNTFITGSVGIGSSVSATASVAVSKNITGGTTSTGIAQNGTVQSDVTTSSRGFFNTLNLPSANTFTLGQYIYYGMATGKPAVLNTTITNSYGYLTDAASLAGVTSYGFFGQLPASSVSTISNVSLTTNVVTVTTAAAHAFWPGQSVVVAATTTTSINGTFTILTCPSTTTFTYALVLGDITSTADTGSATVSGNRWNVYMNGTAPNYFAGGVGIGSTSLNNGYFTLAGTQTSSTAMSYVGGTNQYTGTSVHGMLLNTTLTGTSAVTTSYGVALNPSGTFAAGATVGNFGGINNNPSLTGAVTPTNYYGIQTQQFFGAGALGGTVTTAAAYQASNPSFNAATTTNITTYAAFRASSASNSALNTITNIYAFQGLQNITASSNAYNLFMNGNARNYLAGALGIANTTPDATLAVTGTANVSGNAVFGGTLTTTSYVKTTPTTVASLVAAATAGAGARSFVSDSTVAAAGNFGAIVAGTGSNPVPVHSDGTNWRIG